MNTSLKKKLVTFRSISLSHPWRTSRKCKQVKWKTWWQVLGCRKRMYMNFIFTRMGNRGRKKKRAKKWRLWEVKCVGRAVASVRQNFCIDLTFYLYHRIKKKKSPLLNELGKKETYFHCLNSKHKEKHVHVSVTLSNHSLPCLFIY